MDVKTRKQLEQDLANSVVFILSTTFQVNMDMVNKHQIKVRFSPLDKRPYRFDGENVLEYFVDAMQPTDKNGSAKDVASAVAAHLNQ